MLSESDKCKLPLNSSPGTVSITWFFNPKAGKLCPMGCMGTFVQPTENLLTHIREQTFSCIRSTNKSKNKSLVIRLRFELLFCV